MSTKKILSFVAYFSVMIGSNLFAMKEDSISTKLLYGNSAWGGKAAKFSYKKAKAESLMGLINLFDKIKKDELIPSELLKQMNTQSEDLERMRELKRKIRAIEVQQEQEGRVPDIDAIRMELAAIERSQARQDAEIKAALEELKKDPKFAKWEEDRGKCLTLLLNSFTEEDANDPFGVLVAKALAGPNYNNVLDDITVKSKKEGALMGGTVLVVGALSEVVREKAKSSIDRSVGTLWDFLFDGIINCCSTIRNVLFHDSNKPFDYQKLLGWQEMVLMAYDDIDNMLRNGLRDSTRSLDSVSRQFDDNNNEIQAKKEIDMWASLATGYAEQFAYFVTLFETRREYYDEDDIVVFYSNQICQMLQATCKLLTSSKSLKDLDSKLESQRTIIPAIKRNIQNLFKQLIAEVKPKPSSIKDSTASTASTYKPSTYNAYSGSNQYGYNNDGPTPYASGF